jgi:hypothetical protein
MKLSGMSNRRVHCRLRPGRRLHDYFGKRVGKKELMGLKTDNAREISTIP